MGYFVWYYQKGILVLIKKWIFFLKSIIYYFSPLHLLKSLFAPWKRMTIAYEITGFNLQKYIEVITFNFISRFIGAFVRFFLLVTGVLVLTASFLIGLLLIPFYLLPFWGVFDYQRYLLQPEVYLSGFFKNKNENVFRKFFEKDAGKFFLNHIGVSLEDFLSATNINPSLLAEMPTDSFESFISYLVSKNVWSDDFFMKLGISSEDLIKVAAWWDNLAKQKSGVMEKQSYPSGLALELLTGYTPELNKYSVDLTAPLDFSERLIGRSSVVERMERSLSAGRSVFLSGPSGVGKKTIVLEFARKSSRGELGKEMAYKRILEFDYNLLLAESIDINAKKAKLDQIFQEASYAGDIILVIRDIHRITNLSFEGYDFTDVFEKNLEKGRLLVISILTTKDYERFVAPNIKLRRFFDLVEAEQPTKEEAFEIMINLATKYEREKGVVIPIFVLRKILEESDRYITETPFPEKVLELLEAVVVYCLQKKNFVIGIADVDEVLTERTGILFEITVSQKDKLSNLEEIIHSRLVDQELAVSLIAKTLRSKTLKVVDDKRPIGSFLFLGPTGVGKTEVAKILARVYFGSESEIVRFDMAEFAGREGLERLIGSLTLNQPGLLSTSIKKNPASLLLLDEIEKSSREIMNVFLSILDEGLFTDVFGNKIICRNLFIIGTSNAGAEYIRQLVSSGLPKEKMQKEVVDYVLKEKIFSPEFLNRFDGVVVFNPLSPSDLEKIASLMLSDLSLNLKNKGLRVEITPEAVKKLVLEGYQPEFGARPMRRIIDLVLGDLFGRALLRGEIKQGDRVRLNVGKAHEEFIIEKM